MLILWDVAGIHKRSNAVIHDVWPGDPSRFVSQRLLGAESVKLAQDDILEDAA